MKAKIFPYIHSGSPRTCNLYVYTNASGKPRTQVFSTTYMPKHNSWMEIPITEAVNFDTDFWIVIKLPPSGSSVICATTDDGKNYANRSMARKPSGGVWEVPCSILRGDLCIRAIVSYTGTEEEELSPYESVVLNQNHPNPFVNKTAISYTLPRKTKVELKIYDITGKLVRTLVDGVQQAHGLKRIVWDRKDAQGKAVHSGVYFYKLNTDIGDSLTKVMVVF